MALGRHICFRAHDDRVLTPSDAARRAFATTVRRIAEPYGLLAFRAADTHGHLQALCDRERSGELARRLEIALAKRLQIDCGLWMSANKAIDTQQYLHNTFLYVLRQRTRHGLAADPYHEASSLPDVIGARIGGDDLRARVREHLPRIGLSAVLEIAGLKRLAADPIDPAYLLPATAAAALLPDLQGREVPAVQARAALVALASEHLTTGEIADLLAMTKRGVRSLRCMEAPAALCAAIRRQALFRKAIDALGGAETAAVT